MHVVETLRRRLRAQRHLQHFVLSEEQPEIKIIQTQKGSCMHVCMHARMHSLSTVRLGRRG